MSGAGSRMVNGMYYHYKNYNDEAGCPKLYTMRKNGRSFSIIRTHEKWRLCEMEVIKYKDLGLEVNSIKSELYTSNSTSLPILFTNFKPSDGGGDYPGPRIDTKPVVILEGSGVEDVVVDGVYTSIGADGDGVIGFEQCSKGKSMYFNRTRDRFGRWKWIIQNDESKVKLQLRTITVINKIFYSGVLRDSEFGTYPSIGPRALSYHKG